MMGIKRPGLHLCALAMATSAQGRKRKLAPCLKADPVEVGSCVSETEFRPSLPACFPSQFNAENSLILPLSRRLHNQPTSRRWGGR